MTDLDRRIFSDVEGFLYEHPYVREDEGGNHIRFLFDIINDHAMCDESICPLCNEGVKYMSGAMWWRPDYEVDEEEWLREGYITRAHPRSN